MAPVDRRYSKAILSRCGRTMQSVSDCSCLMQRYLPSSANRSILLTTIFLIIVSNGLLSAVTADDYVGGIPLTTVQTGTVTGDLWYDLSPAPDWGSQNVIKTFMLPDEAVEEPGRIQWARLYISAYAGHMQNDYAFSITNKWDGNNDGTYEQVWPESGHGAFNFIVNGGNDNTARGGGSDDPYLLLSNHENRVTSDYFMWYDVTSLIQGNIVKVNVETTGSFDGRIKVISLVVAYDDPASTVETMYWVNEGHDSCSYYTEENYGIVAVGSTTFDTPGLSDIDSAILSINYLASNNGYYGFPTSENNFVWTGGTPPVDGTFTNAELDRDPDVQGAYSGVDSWDVTDDITGHSEVTLAYARYFPGTGTSAFYKLPLAFLVVKRSSGIAAPVAGFSADVTNGTAPLTVSFLDESANMPTSWAWDFDSDGTIDSAEQDPSFQYAISGTYTVTLTATNDQGSDEEIKTGYITVTPAVAAPVAAFSADRTSGTTPLTVHFKDESKGNITSRAWDFDSDGTIDSTEQNESFTYMEQGNYTVTLTVGGPAGNDTATREIEVVYPSGPAPILAVFSADPTSGPIPLSVQFINNSTGNITSYAWDFGDGTTSTDQNPVHIYNDTGTYTISLFVEGPGGTDNETHEILAFDYEQYAAPVAAFSAQKTSGTTPLVVQFTDNSTGSVTSYSWDFDSDGTVDSTDPNPKYTYFSKGMYNVSLMVSGPGGSDIEVKTNYIIASTPSSITAAFNATPLSGAAPLTVKFTDESKGTVTSWSWDFDNDGMADSTDKNPSFTYYDTGTYSVTLTVGGPGVSNTLKRTDFIAVAETASDCDLYIGGLPTPIGATSFALEPNTVKIFKVGNNGPESSPETEIELKSSDGFTGRVSIPSIEANDEITALIVDTTIRSSVGVKVTYTATIDPDNTVLENNEGNNVKTRQVEVKYNGYKGAQFWGGKEDIRTVAVLDIHGDLIHSFGDSAYRSGSFGNGWNKYTVTWTKDQLEIPQEASVREVRLYVPYCWDNSGTVPNKVSIEFNGKSVPYQFWYHDVSNFGAYWDHEYGLLTYNVTCQFKKNDVNKVVFNRQGDPLFTKLSMYGFTLAVIYEDPDEPRRIIYFNEGFDLLGASEDDYGTTEEEATATIRFSGPSIDKSDVKSADLITFVASGAAQEPGRDGEGNLIINGRTIAQDIWDYGGAAGDFQGEDGTPQVAVDTREISEFLMSNDNEIGVQSTAGLTPAMAPVQAFLVLTMYGDGESDTPAPSGGSSGGGSSSGGSYGTYTLSGESPSSLSANQSANASVSMSSNKSSGITQTTDEMDRRWEQSTTEVFSSQPHVQEETPAGNNQTSGPSASGKTGIPLVIGGFLVSVSGASAIGLFYSVRGIETRYRYLIAALLLIVILVAVSGIFSLKIGDSPSAAAGFEPSKGTISWNAMPVVEGIQDTNPTNSVPDYPEGFTARNGLLFVLAGDGKIRLSDLEVRLSTGQNTVAMTSTTPFSAESTDHSLSSYLEETGNGDGVLAPGEWLMVYADSCLEMRGTGSPDGMAVRWQPGDTPDPVTVFLGDDLSYSLVDHTRGEVLQEGRIEFTPST